jgi:dihydroxy-acid dehydratase
LIELDVSERRLQLRVSEADLEKRRKDWRPRAAPYSRGFGALYAAHVTQAHEGCDFDFLHAGEETPEPEIH